MARVQSSQHHGQVVGLGAAVGQIHHLIGEASTTLSPPLLERNQDKKRLPAYLQGIWQVGRQLLTILMERRVDVDVRSVPQSLQLPLRSRRHFPVVPNANTGSQREPPGRQTQLRTLRVTVAHADGGHTGKQIQVSFPINVPQPLHVTLVDECRFLVVGHPRGHGEAIPLSDRQHSLFRHSLDKGDTRDGKKDSRPGGRRGGQTGFYLKLFWLKITRGHFRDVWSGCFED